MGPHTRLLANSARERTIVRWVHRRLSCVRHEARVLTIADELFELLRPHHHLDRFERRMLRLGAMVHDIGRAVNDRRHPHIGCEMLLVDRGLPLSDVERRCLAYLTRYHRGAVPEIGFDDVLRSGDPRRSMRIVLALLRAADSLDGRQHDEPQVRIKLREGKLKVRCHLSTDCRRARKFFSRRKKFRLLEELLGVKVDLAVRDNAAVATAAR